jgi:transcriptional regulator with XRE-family HTH domain
MGENISTRVAYGRALAEFGDRSDIYVFDSDLKSCTMSMYFAETLRRLRTERAFSQQDLAERMFVSRSTVVRWETGSRLPDVAMISRLSKCLGVEVTTLLRAAAVSDESPNVIMVDDRKIILSGGLPILEEVLPRATVIGFTRPSEAIEYAKANRVALAFLDIELGKVSGFELCRTLLEIDPRTNVVFLTAYVDYSFDAWSTGASGFMLKPITAEGVRAQLRKLRYPFPTGGVLA